jgi:hypothetical protein
MATTLFTLPMASYPSGDTPVPPSSVPAGSTLLTAALDVSHMSDPATEFLMAYQVAIDGVNYQPWASVHRQGGPVPLDKNGAPINNFALGGPLPAPATASTKVRGTISVVGPITVGGTVQAS